MQTFTLRAVSDTNETIEESEVTLESNDVLVLEMPSDVSIELAGSVLKYTKEALSNNTKVIGLPKGIKAKILKIKEINKNE